MAQGLTGGLFTSQYVCSWHAMTSLSPFLRCLAALEEGRGYGDHPPLPHPSAQDLLPGLPDLVPLRVGIGRGRAHRSCSRACITTRSQVWLIFLCNWS